MAVMQISTTVSLSLLLWLSNDLHTIPVSEAARILAIETVAGKSHWYFMSSLLRSLTDAGHTVTVFTPFPDGDRANYTEVDTSHDFPIKLDMDVMETIQKFSGPIALSNSISKVLRFYCDTIHGNRKLVDLLTSGVRDRYDLLLIEPLGIDCVSHIANALDLPVIYSIPSPIVTFTEWTFTGHLSNPSYVSNIFANHAVPSTFVQRFTNTALLTYSMARIRCEQLVFRLMDARPYDPTPIVNPSIIFQNSHYVTESPRPLTPNVVYVGGIHLKPAKTIPKKGKRCRFRTHRRKTISPLPFRQCLVVFLDGGLISNNPTLDTLTEIEEYNLALYKTNRAHEIHDPSLVVSVETRSIPVTEIFCILCLVYVKNLDIFKPSSVSDSLRLVFGFSALGLLLIDQATQSDGRVVDRARSLCYKTKTRVLQVLPTTIRRYSYGRKR
ncbi:UDP-glucuronosyltransferase 1-7C-like [Melanaphis sacchari]|uniref:UDP-glucuronosyltransferase 1-7C-like n=1 Tax=Melanaphis sacchari TaxID=742174 RepID=UPI000DC1463D|nr:UDP-glucuronosyltransferase 1-7C-like [Melanaphis sacchari]